MFSHKVVEWPDDGLDAVVRVVHEAVDGELVGGVHGLRTSYVMQHGADDDVGVDDGQVKSRLVLLHKLPRRFLGQRLPCVVAEDGALALGCDFSRYLSRMNDERFGTEK